MRAERRPPYTRETITRSIHSNALIKFRSIINQIIIVYVCRPCKYFKGVCQQQHLKKIQLYLKSRSHLSTLVEPKSLTLHYLLSLQKFFRCVLYLHHAESQMDIPWVCSVNTDEHRTCDNVRVVRDRPKHLYSNNVCLKT